MTEQYRCLIVDFTGTLQDAACQTAAKEQSFGMPIVFAANATTAKQHLDTCTIAVMAVRADADAPDLQATMRSFLTSVGAIGDFQCVICAEPSPEFMAAVFEFGIEQFFPPDTWAADLGTLTRAAADVLKNTASAEGKTLALTRSVKRADRNAITKAQEALGDLADYDSRIAFAKGKAAEATGDYEGAAKAFETAQNVNKMFRPSTTSLGESLMVLGKVDEAIALFQKLEKTNPNSVERKSSLAAAYIAKGDPETAKKYAAEAAKLAPTNPKAIEAQAQVLLGTGDIAGAFKLLDKLTEIGPYFAVMLNETGIKMSQAGKGQSALALYQKAHKIVRPELRFKISMNAALACRRMGDMVQAEQYLFRCEKEYGGKYDKLVKILAAVQAAKKAGVTPATVAATAPAAGAGAVTPSASIPNGTKPAAPKPAPTAAAPKPASPPAAKPAAPATPVAATPPTNKKAS